MVAIFSTSNTMDLLLAQTVGLEFICIHYRERWSPANGCNLGTFVPAVCSCCSSDEGVILAHFLITNHLWCSYKAGCLSVPGKHNEKQRNCEETQEKATLRIKVKGPSAGLGKSAAVIYARWHWSPCWSCLLGLHATRPAAWYRPRPTSNQIQNNSNVFSWRMRCKLWVPLGVLQLDADHTCRDYHNKLLAGKQQKKKHKSHIHVMLLHLDTTSH